MGLICSIDDCGGSVVARGWCGAHYHRWQRYEDPLGSGVRNPFIDPVKRFTSKYRVDEGTGCWMWTGAKNRDGYGSFGVRGRRFTMLAHRWSYQHHVGEIPDGLCVLHQCDNPSCVNPEHLFLGTQADNVADCVRKGRRNQKRVNKLTPEQRDLIVFAYATGTWTQSKLGELFGVSQVTVSKIVRSA